jgi:hypothetical protein
VLGPVGANDLLREAEWAVKEYETVKRSRPEDQKARLATAHRDAARQRGNGQSPIHEFLAARPLAGLKDIYRPVFANLLGEGQRASGIESARVLALQDENERLREDVERTAEEARIKAEKEKKAQTRREESLQWLRTALTYLEAGEEEAAKARLEMIVSRFPNTKAAEKARELLAERLQSAPSNAATKE